MKRRAELLRIHLRQSKKPWLRGPEAAPRTPAKGFGPLSRGGTASRSRRWAKNIGSSGDFFHHCPISKFGLSRTVVMAKCPPPPRPCLQASLLLPPSPMFYIFLHPCIWDEDPFVLFIYVIAFVMSKYSINHIRYCCQRTGLDLTCFPWFFCVLRKWMVGNGFLWSHGLEH